MATYLFPDALADIRTYLRSLNLGGIVGSRVFFRWPDTYEGPWPAVRMYRAGGAAHLGVPLQDLRIVIEVHGRPINSPSGTPGTFDDVSAVTAHLESALFEIEEQPIGAQTVVGGVQVTGVTPSPDPDDGAPRNIVDTIWTVRAGSSAQVTSGFGGSGFGQ